MDMSQQTQKSARPVTVALDRLEHLYEQASAGLEFPPDGVACKIELRLAPSGSPA